MLHGGNFNIGAFATPYLAGFVGPQAMIYSSLFDIGGAVAGAGVGYAWGMSLLGEPGGTASARSSGRSSRTPILITYVALLALKLFDLRLPDALITFTSTVGAANPFLAMLMIGIGLELQLHPGKYWAAARMLAIRYASAAVAAVAFWTLLPLPAEARLVLVMVVFSPIASMIAGFTGKAGTRRGAVGVHDLGEPAGRHRRHADALPQPARGLSRTRPEPDAASPAGARPPDGSRQATVRNRRRARISDGRPA